MGIGKTAPAKIGHGIGFAPNNVIEHPEAQILQGRADPENIVIGTNDPKAGLRLHDAAALGQPSAGKGVIIGKACEFIPIIVDRIHYALVGARQSAFQLQIIGGIGKNEIHTGIGGTWPAWRGFSVAMPDLRATVCTASDLR